MVFLYVPLYSALLLHFIVLYQSPTALTKKKQTFTSSSYSTYAETILET
jgi:hypothetical protein